LRGAQAHRRPGAMGDGAGGAAWERVVDPAALVRRAEPRRDQFVTSEALAREVVQQVIPPLRRIADTEVRRGARIEAAATKERTRRLGLGREELVAEVLGRLRVGGGHAGAAGRRLGRGPAALR